MCGICGYITTKEDKSSRTIEKMVETLKHRGPDAQKVNLYENNKIGLGHTRLSIIDLSEKANQPMFYKDLSIGFSRKIQKSKINWWYHYMEITYVSNVV